LTKYEEKLKKEEERFKNLSKTWSIKNKKKEHKNQLRI